MSFIYICIYTFPNRLYIYVVGLCTLITVPLPINKKEKKERKKKLGHYRNLFALPEWEKLQQPDVRDWRLSASWGPF